MAGRCSMTSRSTGGTRPEVHTLAQVMKPTLKAKAKATRHVDNVGEASASKRHSGTSCALVSPFTSPRMREGGDLSLAISAAEATPHHVLAHIEVLESHANDEIWEGVSYATLPLPFGTAFDVARAEDFYPTIIGALGMRDHAAQDESMEDTALAARHSTQWYYFALRCTEPGRRHEKLAVIKARSPAPCHALVIKMLGLSPEVSPGATFAPIVLLGASTGPRYDDLQEGAAIARRLWRAGLSRGGSVLSQATSGVLPGATPQGTALQHAALQGFTWMRMPSEGAMDGLWTATFLHPSARHLALMRKLLTASRVAAPLLSLHKEAIEKSYAPSGAGYKRAREEFESHLVPKGVDSVEARWSA